MATETESLIHAVKSWARDHYDVSGWDYVVEAMDDNEIAGIISQAKTADEAIRVMKKHVKVLDDRRTDIGKEAF